MDEEKISTNKLIVAGFICIMFYALFFALNAAKSQITDIPIIGLILSIPSFESPMFFAMPFFAFFAIFFLVDWINSSFKTRLAFNPVFPLLFFLLTLAAYYLALYWYVANFVALQGQEMSLDQIDFWGKLHDSAFMLFLWGGVFGWIARFAVEKLKL